MASTSEAQMKMEIARLTASINSYKSGGPSRTSAHPSVRPKGNTYVNPNYNPPNKYVRPTTTTIKPQPSTSQPRPVPGVAQIKEVVLGGIAFESSGRSLVRKDLPKTVSPALVKPVNNRHSKFPKTPDYHIPNRSYKPKASRGRRGGPINRNMTLNNSRRPYQARRLSTKRKYSDKPCPRFTTTGACSRGLTCLYQHDPSKIAICWNFLQDNCPNSADTCNLSHDPTPQRTPLCLHFLNKGRCTRENCPFPHVNVGARQGVCRDFAVLGYCEKGLDCDKQHVRECPDFAEKGTCSTKGCKLPHVIRANRNRKPVITPSTTLASTSAVAAVADSNYSPEANHDSGFQQVSSAEDAQLGDEYISLTFNESESSEDDEEEDEDEDDEGNDDEESEDLDDDEHMSE